jgi:hypothetical protein
MLKTTFVQLDPANECSKFTTTCVCIQASVNACGRTYQEVKIKMVTGAYNGVRNANFCIDVQFELRCISFKLGNRLLQPETCHYII